MKCPGCQFDNPGGMQFCGRCGARLTNICPECEYANPPEFQFCGKCGAKLGEAISTTAEATVPKLEDMHTQLQSLIPDELAQKYMTAEQQATGENRPITALFADISGFTPLSNTQSSETMFQLVQECFRELVGIVARYEGSISGFRGDGLLALFGAPILHENDAERAILAALGMHTTMADKQLQVSIGINTAMMTVGEIQTQLHREYTAYGTDINLAKRLQEAAEPGQILVGTGTHRLTRRMFDFEALAGLNVKGFQEKITAYTVQQVKERPEKLRGIEGLRARMIGREHEFADLKEAADAWLDGQGQIVSIIGEAGIGKSRLVSELREYLGERGGEGAGNLSTLEGRCVSIGQPISYWLFLDILRSYFGLSEEDDVPTRARKVTEAITHLMPQGADEALPLLGNLLSIKFGDDLDDRLKFAGPEQIRHQTLMRLRDLFETLARQQPLLLILEDLHWADDLSLDLISLLMDELANTPLMLLCVYRPERDHRVWQLGDQARRKCLDRYTELTLHPLSSHQSRLLVESLLEIDNLPEPTKDVILTKSEGNPFFIEEVIRSLIEQDVVYLEDNRWKARDEIANIHVPDTIQSVVLARVDRLQEDAKYVLRCASVIGRLFRYRLLQHISQQERDLDRYLSDFEEKELVYEERTVPELEYAFKHAFTQEATYEGILEQHRREFHHQVAQGIERLYQERIEEYYEELAHHYSRSEDTEKAVEYLLKAGEKCKQIYANQDAIRYYNEALAVVDKPGKTDEYGSQKFQAMEGLGDVHQTIGKHNDATAYFEKAIELGTKQRLTPAKLAELYSKAAYTYFSWMNQMDKRIETAQTGLAVLGQNTDCPQAAILFSALAGAYEHKHDAAKASEYASKAAAIVKNLGYFDGIYIVYGRIAWTNGFMKQDPGYAISWQKKSLEMCERYNDKKGIVFSCHGLGDTLNFLEDSREAIHWYKKAISIAEDIGDVVKMTWCHVDLGGMLVRLREELEEAEEHLKVGAKIASEIGDNKYIALACTFLKQVSDIHLAKGDWDKVIDSFKTLSEETVHPAYMAHKHGQLGILAMCECRWDEAISHFQESCKLQRDWGYPQATINSDITLGRAYLRKGDFRQAVKIFAEVVDESITIPSESARSAKFRQALAGLEQAYIALGQPGKFIEFCDSFKELHTDVMTKVALPQWYLECVEPLVDFPELSFADDFDSATLDPSWVWVDNSCDSSYNVDKSKGLAISAANGRGLTNRRQDAPRLLKEVSGDFAVEVCISPASGEKPQIGGILVWKDSDRLLSFENGCYEKHEVVMSGRHERKWRFAGRGFLPVDNDVELHLRLERAGDQFSSYCSIDGENWLTCGKMTLPMEDPIQIGIHAIGMIDRTIYCGAYKEGTATVFRNFRIWTRESQ